jgi:3',5'-cyclic AMP phosphodiesterase CpdA
MDGMFVFAHISDTHFSDGRALRRVRDVMGWLSGMPLDAILVTGDIADHGAVAEYEQARDELAAGDVPVLMLPGNHDERGAYRKVLLDDGGAAPVNEARVVGGVLFALCDSSIPGRNDGLLGPETLAWLDGVLAGHDGPAFVCLHHPPVVLHQPLIDGIRLGDAAALAAVVGAHPGVVAVLCGHAHTAAVSTFAGRPVVVAPGVVSALHLPWAVADPLTWQNTVDLADPPAVAFHVLDEGRLTTHFRAVPAG